MHNKVIDGSHINDPTAHGERQIVDWYLANKEKEGLPEPEGCILITTLDPCVMCTGAITQANFGKVIVIALDDFAGINWEGTSACSALEGTDAQEYVREHFAYPEVTGELAREAFGADLSDVDIFSDVTVTSETLKGCQDAFNLSADAVRSKVAASSVEAADVQDPAKLDETHPIRAYLAEKFGSDFLACTWKPGEAPDAFLSYVEKAHPGFDGVAYFDQFGNLIFLAENDPDISVQSAFMRTTRKVAEARNSEPIEGYDVDAFLQNPRNGYFVYMTCPKPSAKTIMELGAIGSTLETTAEHPIMYINGAENEEKIESIIARMPPLYNSVIGIDFEQITPAASE